MSETVGRHLGLRLRLLRKLSGIAQYDLARYLGRSQTEISRWEHGEIRIPAQELPSIARCLNCTIDDFFTMAPPIHKEVTTHEG